MPYLAYKKNQLDNAPLQDRRVLEAALRDVSLGNPALMKNPAEVEWYVYFSLNLGYDDLTLFGSAVPLILRTEGFPWDQYERVFRGSQQQGVFSQFLWGVLVEAPEAPLTWIEDITYDPETEDGFALVYEANTGAANFTQAGLNIPEDWVTIELDVQPPPPPEEEEAVALPTLLVPFGPEWSDITQTDLESLSKSDLQIVADELELVVVGTGTGGAVLKADLVAAILAFAQAQP